MNLSQKDSEWVQWVGKGFFFSCNVGSNEAKGIYTPPFGTRHHPWRTKSRRLKKQNKKTKQDERRNKQNHVTSSQIKLVPTI